MLDHKRFAKYTPSKTQNIYVKALTDKDVKISPCLRCGCTSYGVAGASSPHGVFGTNQSIVMELPCVLIVCSNCGFKSEFSTKELGIKEEDVT